MVKVKICGITSWADAKLAVEAGADALGFNFYPRSPRYVAPERAKRIVSRLPSRVQAIGVFVNESPATIEAIARAVDLDGLQLHGEESPASVARLARHWRVIKAFRVGPGFRNSRLARYREAEAFLLDGFSPRARGGTGRKFDWRVARRAKRYGRIFLAGGLAVENVAVAIRSVRPYGIDVCSGVEAKPGKKNSKRVCALMKQVKKVNRRIR